MAKPQLENGHTKIANELVEALARTYFTAYESRILWTIFRKTYGWNKKTDRISYVHFQDATGIDHRHVGRTLKALKNRNIITCFGSGYQLEYGIQKDYDKWDLTPNEAPIIKAKSVPQTVNAVPNEAPNLTPNEAHTKAYKANKDTITKAREPLPSWIIKEVWDGFMEVRLRLKAPNTDRAITALINKLTEYKNKGFDPNEVIEQSTMNGWKGVFPLKDQNFGQKDKYHGNVGFKKQPPGTGSQITFIDGDAESQDTGAGIQ